MSEPKFITNIVTDTATFLYQIKQDLDTGKISQNEFEELVKDATSLETIQHLTNSLTQQNQIQQHFQTLRMIAGIIAPIV